MTTSVELRSRFGRRVCIILEHANLKSTDLAARTGMPVARIERILSGRLARLTLRDMTLIAASLGMTTDLLLAPGDPTIPVVPLEIIEESGPGDA
ncbi:MAG: hypothetical protein DI605_18815 [Sphingomonas sp.]|nr:MAG: hypothetical protein DI605_18815 [Sphingomonas sp.]